MGCLKDPNYVREFTYRTKLNYYRCMSLYSDNKEQYFQKISELEYQMKKENYVIEEYYEVTGLINSLIGLLVFPESNLYNKMSDEEEKLKLQFPNLYLLSQDESYINTYYNQKNTPRVLIHHMRNSLSHDRVMIYPRNKKNEKTISKIIMQDCCVRGEYNPNKKKYEYDKELEKKLNAHFGDIRDLKLDINKDISLFSIEIPVEKLEDVFMEICDYSLKESR